MARMVCQAPDQRIVVGWNLECALVFLLSPAQYTAGFELSGVAGEAAVRGMAVLFVMWNIPYIVALWQPSGTGFHYGRRWRCR